MSDQSSYGGPVVVLYAVGIHEATQSGDRAKMQAMEQQASQHLEEVESALKELRAALGSNS